MEDHNLKESERGPPKEHFCENVEEIGPIVFEEKIFKDFPSFKHMVAMATRVLHKRP